ncbi:hypothetical protein BC826DRAFT_316310 [Russula brevipes]|nr:hypothetical protein BC826DRAFT_316310 [Russula brevipes]
MKYFYSLRFVCPPLGSVPSCITVALSFPPLFFSFFLFFSESEMRNGPYNARARFSHVAPVPTGGNPGDLPTSRNCGVAAPFNDMLRLHSIIHSVTCTSLEGPRFCQCRSTRTTSARYAPVHLGLAPFPSIMPSKCHGSRRLFGTVPACGRARSCA